MFEVQLKLFPFEEEIQNHWIYKTDKSLNAFSKSWLKLLQICVSCRKNFLLQMIRGDPIFLSRSFSLAFWPVWLNGWVFIYKLSGCEFESRHSHLKLRYHACFEQGVPWHSGNYRVWIHNETSTWHDKNIQ